MGSKVLNYGETCINKNAFHKKATSINIDEVEINKIILFDKTSYGNKVHLNIMLDIDTKMKPFHHHKT